uniref:Uncharacterized protein n=1 Tax=Parastrongyloides trichosuri TaxID=131310 RepID=A0A0N5A520_PARTI
METRSMKTAPPYSQSCVMKVSRKITPKKRIASNRESTEQRNTQEEYTCSESEFTLENEEKNIGISSKSENIECKDKNKNEPNMSQYIMKVINDPVGNEAINKGVNQNNQSGYWGFGVISNYVMDGIQKVYPLSGGPQRTHSKGNSDSSSTESMTMKRSLNSKITKDSNKEFIIGSPVSEKHSPTTSDLFKGTHTYLPNWDTLVGATSNFMETTTSAIKTATQASTSAIKTATEASTSAIKTATQASIKNLQNINQKALSKENKSNQLYGESNKGSYSDNVKMAADYGYIDLVSANKALEDNEKNN